MSENSQRGERKFVLSGMTFHELLSLVHLHPSGFTEQYASRQVNNVYFDSLEYGNYIDNVHGVSERLKIRLRWYGAMDRAVDPVLQLKIKKGYGGIKMDYPTPEAGLSPGVPWSRIRDSIRKSLPREISSLFDFYSFPAVANCYRRNYFISSDRQYRLTLDRDIKYFAQTHGLYPNTTKSEIVTDEMIVEIKYPIELDPLASEVTSWFPFRVSKNSKYISGLNLIWDDV